MSIVDLVGEQDEPVKREKFEIKKTDDAGRHPLRNTQGDV